MLYDGWIQLAQEWNSMEGFWSAFRDLVTKDNRFAIAVFLISFGGAIFFKADIPANFFWIFKLIAYGSGVIILINFIHTLLIQRQKISNFVFVFKKVSDDEKSLLKAFFISGKDGLIKADSFEHYESHTAYFLKVASSLCRRGYMRQIPVLGKPAYIVTEKGRNYLLKEDLAE